jgi:hypothetical protein
MMGTRWGPVNQAVPVLPIREVPASECFNNIVGRMTSTIGAFVDNVTAREVWVLFSEVWTFLQILPSFAGLLLRVFAGGLQNCFRRAAIAFKAAF